jgi:hypothetical protein
MIIGIMNMMNITNKYDKSREAIVVIHQNSKKDIKNREWRNEVKRYKGQYKGQAAMEYLLTYGWALVIIALIMAILYSTIFKPEFYVAESCNMAPGLECNPQMMSLKSLTGPKEGANLSFELTNSMTYNINFSTLEFVVSDLSAAGEKHYTISCIPSCISCSSSDGSGECEASGVWKVTPSIARGNATRIEVLFYGNHPIPNKLYRIKFILNYTINETGTKHRTAGILNVRGS